jgi:flavin-dependent trigonelline monooxygenase, oxygenase component
VVREALEIVKLADEAGFAVVWAAEHHTIEYTIAPNPLTLLTYWAAHTRQVRLGTAVIVAPYWHPIRLAGEVALVDQLTAGRLEVGIARGAYQYEFDRLAGGMPQRQGSAHLREIVPAIKQLWAGDYTHNGELWQFPRATSVPKPYQQPYPPLWVAARDPDTYDWAVKNDLNIMATPLSLPFSEVINLSEKLTKAVANNPGHPRPKFMMSRSTHVFEDPRDWDLVAENILESGGRFDALFNNTGNVINGFTQPTIQAEGGHADARQELEREGTMYGSPAEIVERLHAHAALGIDQYCISTRAGLPHALQMRSLDLFATKVMPHFASTATPA